MNRNEGDAGDETCSESGATVPGWSECAHARVSALYPSRNALGIAKRPAKRAGALCVRMDVTSNHLYESVIENTLLERRSEVGVLIPFIPCIPVSKAFTFTFRSFTGVICFFTQIHTLFVRPMESDILPRIRARFLRLNPPRQPTSGILFRVFIPSAMLEPRSIEVPACSAWPTSPSWSWEWALLHALHLRYIPPQGWSGRIL